MTLGPPVCAVAWALSRCIASPPAPASPMRTVSRPSTRRPARRLAPSPGRSSSNISGTRPGSSPFRPTPAVPPVTDALPAVAAHQRGGYAYAIDPYFDPHRAVPPYGIVGAGPSTTPAAWSPSATTRTTADHQWRWSSPPRSPLWRSPCTWPSPGYGSEADLFAAFRGAALSVFPRIRNGPTHCDRPRQQSLHRGLHPSRPHDENLAPVAPDHGSRARNRRSPGPAQPGASHQPARPGGGTARLGRHEAYVPCRAGQHLQGGPALLTRLQHAVVLMRFGVATSSGTRLFTYQ
jgi:hypothetical protein